MEYYLYLSIGFPKMDLSYFVTKITKIACSIITCYSLWKSNGQPTCYVFHFDDRDIFNFSAFKWYHMEALESILLIWSGALTLCQKILGVVLISMHQNLIWGSHSVEYEGYQGELLCSLMVCLFAYWTYSSTLKIEVVCSSENKILPDCMASHP